MLKQWQKNPGKNGNFEPVSSRAAASHPERGVFLVFFALMALCLLSVMALSIEVGRLLIASRQLQNAADAAALAGVQMLQECNRDADQHDSIPLDNNCPTSSSPYSGAQTSFGGWRAVKPAAMAVLSEATILGKCMGPVTAFRLDSANPSLCDLGETHPYASMYGNLSGMSGNNGQGLSFIIRRQFECQESTTSNFVHFKDLDKNPDPPSGIIPDYNTAFDPSVSSSASNQFPYCVANRVRVDLTYSGVDLLFLGLLEQIGVAGPFIIHKTGVATVKKPMCGGRPVCSLYDNVGIAGAASCYVPMTVNECTTPAALIWTPTSTPLPTATPLATSTPG